MNPPPTQGKIEACAADYLIQVIQLPPLNSSRNGPPQGHSAPVKATRVLRHQPLERRTPAAQSRPKTATGIG